MKSEVEPCVEDFDNMRAEMYELMSPSEPGVSEFLLGLTRLQGCEGCGTQYSFFCRLVSLKL